MQNQTITKPWYKFIPHIWEIPEDWEVKKIWNLWKLYRWHSYDSSNVVDKWLLVLRSSNIKDNKLILDNDLQFVNNQCNKNIELQNNDLVICMANWSKELVWKTAKYKWNYKWQVTVWAFCAIFRMDNHYSEYLFNSPKYREYLHVLLAGTNINNLKGSELEELKFAIPKNINEQQKIANILNTCDSQIETIKQIIQKIELRNRGLQQQLLTWKKRLPWFSEDWSNKHLSEVFDRVTRKNSEWNDNVLTISAQKGLINQENFFNKQVASKILDDYFLLYKWEFAYNKSYSNWYPMWAIKRLNYYDKWVVTTLYICFSIKENLNYSSNFFEKYFESWMLIKWLTQIAHEWWRAHWLLNVTPSDFFNLKVLIPNSKEQKAIADILDKATEQLNEYKEKLEKLELQKKGLMQQLLTGKTRVKV